MRAGAVTDRSDTKPRLATLRRSLLTTLAVFIVGFALASAGGQTGVSAASTADPGSNQEPAMTHQPQAGSARVKPPPPTASTTAYREAAAQMHLDMGIRYSGQADKDFAALVAAHQQGAAALAQIELQYGSDPEMRRLAEAIKASNEKQAALLRAWQAKHP
jgi:uncharacterized protein (DUF305 family)